MIVIINVDGVEREWRAPYERLHVKDWNEVVRELLDVAIEYDNENN